MELWTSVREQWFTLLQTAGIVGGLLFTAVSLRAEAQARRTGNLLKLTEEHRRIWSELFNRPELGRVLRADLPPSSARATDAEELFIRLLVLHLAGAYRAMVRGEFQSPEALRLDVGWFFSLPIPRVVWERWEPFQDADFAAFVRECRERFLEEHAPK